MNDEAQDIARIEYNKAAMTNSAPYESPLRELGSTILYLTSPDDELREFELDLRNVYVKDEQLVQAGEPLLNELGIRTVLRHVRPTVNRLSIMSNYQRNRINAKIMMMVDSLTVDLMLNRKKYGVKNVHKCTVIINSAVDYCESSLGRADEQGERRFLKGSHQEYTLHNEAKKSGFMGNMLGWGKK